MCYKYTRKRFWRPQRRYIHPFSGRIKKKKKKKNCAHISASCVFCTCMQHASVFWSPPSTHYTNSALPNSPTRLADPWVSLCSLVWRNEPQAKKKKKKKKKKTNKQTNKQTCPPLWVATFALAKKKKKKEKKIIWIKKASRPFFCPLVCCFFFFLFLLFFIYYCFCFSVSARSEKKKVKNLSNKNCVCFFFACDLMTSLLWDFHFFFFFGFIWRHRGYEIFFSPFSVQKYLRAFQNDIWSWYCIFVCEKAWWFH